MSADAVLTGGCFCGRIRYETNGAPFHATLCHCADCRRAAGAPALAWYSVARGQFRFTSGEPRIFRSSRKAIRRFCPDCGTQLTWEGDDLPDELDVTIASLDTPDRVPPADHTYAASRIAWDYLSPDFPERVLEATAPSVARPETL